MTVSELFKSCAFSPSGPVKWRARVSERSPGVYVVARVNSTDAHCGSHDVSYLPADERALWIDDEPVLYIGCTSRPLEDRIAEFYRHKPGKRAPHSGGEAIKLLSCDLWVYWSATSRDPFEVEHELLQAFKANAGGRRPYANRK